MTNSDQLNKLLDLMYEYTTPAHPRTNRAREYAKEFWTETAITLNALSPQTPPKTEEQWCRMWRYHKHRVRTKLNNGVQIEELSHFETKIAELLIITCSIRFDQTNNVVDNEDSGEADMAYMSASSNNDPPEANKIDPNIHLSKKRPAFLYEKPSARIARRNSQAEQSNQMKLPTKTPQKITTRRATVNYSTLTPTSSQVPLENLPQPTKNTFKAKESTSKSPKVTPSPTNATDTYYKTQAQLMRNLEQTDTPQSNKQPESEQVSATAGHVKSNQKKQVSFGNSESSQVSQCRQPQASTEIHQTHSPQNIQQLTNPRQRENVNSSAQNDVPAQATKAIPKPCTSTTDDETDDLPIVDQFDDVLLTFSKVAQQWSDAVVSQTQTACARAQAAMKEAESCSAMAQSLQSIAKSLKQISRKRHIQASDEDSAGN